MEDFQFVHEVSKTTLLKCHKKTSSAIDEVHYPVTDM